MSKSINEKRAVTQYLKILDYAKKYSKNNYAKNKKIILDKMLLKRKKMYREFPFKVSPNFIKFTKQFNKEIRKGVKLCKIKINKNTSFVNPLLKHCKTHINLEKIVKIPIPKRIFILKKQLQSALKLTLKKYTFNSQDFKRSKKILQYNLNKQNYIKKKCVNLDIKKHFKL